mgnify:CR=1 FL=1
MKDNNEINENFQKVSINWYPGLMANAIKEINEKVNIVDLVIVLLDARIPKSSFNPLLEEVLNNRKVLYQSLIPI